MRQKICGIYKITEKSTGKCYIGQAVDIHRRWVRHRQIYSEVSFSYEIIMECDREQLDFWEIAWIASEKSVVPYGFNKTLGGQKNGIPSDETRLKQSKLMKGRIRSQEHCNNLSKALTGNTIPLDTRQRISKTMSEQGRMKSMNLSQSTCEHCGLTGNANAMKRWHHNNCKESSNAS